MENTLFKKIVKIMLAIVSPLTLLALILFSEQPEIALAFFTGALLGTLRLKVFWSYISSTINNEKPNKNTISLIKYLASLVFTLAAIGFVLLKSVTMGLAGLSGLIAVPIIVTIYAMFTGISLYRKR